MRNNATQICAVTLLLAAGAPITVFADPLDPVTVTNSGSTNFRGYTFNITSDGSIDYDDGSRTLKKRSVNPTLAQHFFEDVNAAEPFVAQSATHCAKSVSFGTTTSIVYHNEKITDVSCPGNPQIAAIYADLQKIESAGGILGGPRLSQPRQRVFPPGGASAP